MIKRILVFGLIILMIIIFVKAVDYGAGNPFCGAIVNESSLLSVTQNCIDPTPNGGVINNTGVVLDCQGNTVSGPGDNTGFGIKTNASGNNAIIKRCIVDQFQYNINISTNNVTVIDSRIANTLGGAKDIWLNQSINATFLNVTFTTANAQVSANSNLFVAPSLTIINVSTSSGIPVSNSQITIFNKTGFGFSYTGTTNSLGQFNATIPRYFINSSGVQGTIAYNVTATNGANSTSNLSFVSTATIGIIQYINLIVDAPATPTYIYTHLNNSRLNITISAGSTIMINGTLYEKKTVVINMTQTANYIDGYMFNSAGSYTLDTSATQVVVDDNFNTAETNYAFFDFNTSVIPDGSNVTNVNISLMTSANEGSFNINIRDMNQTADSLNDLGYSGRVILEQKCLGTAGSNISLANSPVYSGISQGNRVNTQLNSNATNDLASMLFQDFFSICISRYGAISLPDGQSMYFNSSESSAKPQLIVTYFSPFNATIQLYNNGTLINNGTSPISNSTIFNTAGIYNITAIYLGNATYASSFETWWINVTGALDTSPPSFLNILANQTSAIVNQFINFTVNVIDDIQTNVAWLSHTFDLTGQTNITLIPAATSFTSFGLNTHKGQTFSFTTTSYLKSACYVIYNITSAGTRGNILFNVYAVNDSGVPIGSKLTTTETILASSINSSQIFRCVNFSNPPELIGGVKYMVLVSSPASSGATIYRLTTSTSSNPYPNGISVTNASGSWSYSNLIDFKFNFTAGTFGEKNETPISVSSANANISFVKQLLYSKATPFTYRWCANDTSNNLNCSAYQNYNVLSTLDTILPTGSILSPTNNTKVNGNLTITASASDNVAVSYVSFQYKNSTVSYTNISSCEQVTSGFNCTWNTALFSNATEGYDIQIVVVDTSNNLNNSITPRHFIIDRQAPIIISTSVTYPISQSSIRNTQTLIFRVNTTDGSGAGINMSRVNLTQLNGTGISNMLLQSGNQGSGNYSFWNISVILSGSITGSKQIPYEINDSSTPLQNIFSSSFTTVIDNTAPNWSDISIPTNPIYNNTQINFQVHSFDNLNLSYYKFANNFSGSWVNITKNFTSVVSETDDYATNVSVMFTGNYSWYFIIYDDAGNSNQTTIQNISILGNAPPDITINLISPVNEANFTTNPINFGYNYTGNNASSCLLFVDNVQVNYSVSPTINITLNFSNTIQNGNLPWSVKCNNSNNLFSESEERIINVDTTNPNGTLISPINNTFTNNTNQNLTVNATDNLGIKNATLNIYNSTNSLINQTTTTLTGELQKLIGIVVTLVNGIYTWFYQLFDNLGNSFTTNNNTITIDTIVPGIIINSPSNNSNSADHNVNVNFNATDPNLFNCWWNVNNGVNTTTSCTSGIISSFSNSYAVGSNTVRVYANDSAGNLNSSIVTFSINTGLSILYDSGANNNASFNAYETTTSGFVKTFPPNGSIPPGDGLAEFTTSNYNFIRIIDSNKFPIAPADSALANAKVAIFNITLAKNTNITYNTINWSFTGLPSNTQVNASFWMWNYSSSNWSECTNSISTGIGDDINQSCYSSSSDFINNSRIPIFMIYVFDKSVNSLTGQYNLNYISANISYYQLTSSLVSPSNNSRINTNPVTFNCSATDTLGLSNITLYGNFTGSFIANKTNSATSTSNSTNFSLSLTDGTYSWNCLAVSSDNLRSTFASSNFTFTLDTALPNGTLLLPTNNTYSNVSSNNLTANLTDNLGIKNYTLYIYNNSNPSQLINQTTNINTIETITQQVVGIVVVLVDGVYRWFYSIFDWSGNQFATTNNTLTIDTIKPTINFTAPTETTGNYKNQNFVFVNVTYSETNFANITFVLYNSTSLVNQSIYLTQIKTINWTSLPNTIYFYNVTIIDLANNRNITETRNLTLDTVNPSLTLYFPTNTIYKDLYSYNFSLNFSSTDTNLNRTSYSLNSNFNITINSSVNSSFIALAGNNNITIYSEDKAGNLNSASITFNLTFTPKINNTFVYNSTTTFSRTSVVNVTAWYKLDKNYSIQEDNTGINNASVNNLSFTDSGKIGGAYQFNTSGYLNISSNLLNNFGNKNWTFNLWVYHQNNFSDGVVANSQALFGSSDNTGNNIYLSLINNNYRLRFGTTTDASIISTPQKSGKWTMITGIFSSTNLTLYIDGEFKATTNITGSGNPFSSIYSNLASNSQLYIGNAAGISKFNGTIDEFIVYNRTLTSGDIINLYSITNPTFQEYANVTINSTILDEDTSQSNLYYLWYINGVQNTAGFNNKSINSLFSLRSNNVTLIVNDTLNYKVTQYWNITINYVAPIIIINYPSNNSNFSTISIQVNFTATDPNLNSCWSTKNNGGLNSSRMCTSGNISNFTDIYSEGLNTIIVYANDTLGNINSNSSTFRVDTISPSLTISYPANNLIIKDLYSYNVSLNVTATDSGVGIQTYKYSLNGASNITFTPNTTISPIAGNNNIWVYVNDSLGNLNSTNIVFNLTFTPKINNINISNSTTSYTRTDVLTGLVGWWKFDKNWTNQEDSTGNSNNYNATVTTNTSFTPNGKIGGAYTFDDKDVRNRISVLNTADDFEVENMTFAIWVKPNVVTANMYFFDHYNWRFYTSSNSYVFAVGRMENATGPTNATGNAYTANGGSLIANNWIYLVGVYSPDPVGGTGNIKLYVNGILNSTTNIEAQKIWIGYGSENLEWGNSNHGVAVPFNGTLDETRIYNRSLSASEIYSLYSITNPTFQEYANQTINLTSTDEDTPESSRWYDWWVNNIWQSVSGFAKGLVSFVLTGRSNNVTVYISDTNNYQVSQTFISNTTYINPTINFTSPTPTNNTISSVSTFIVNVTGTEPNRDTVLFVFGATNYTPTCSGIPIYVCNYSFSLSDGAYNYYAYINDTVGNINNTETRTITIDTTNPLISFTSPTENSGVNLSRNYIEANVSVTEVNFVNITFNLYNLTSLVNSTIYSTQTFYINWSNLVETTYNYNVSVRDLANRINSTETRTITIDTTNPNATLIFPTNNTINSTASQNFTANITDNLGIKNATLNIYNSTNSLINQTTTTLTGELQKVVGIVVAIADGVYKWFYSIFDWAGNSFTTQNNTLTIDSSIPTLTVLSPTNTNYRDLYTYNVSLNISVSDTYLDKIFYSLNGATNITFIGNTSFIAQAGSNILIVYANDSAGNINSSTVNFNLTFTPKINDINISNSTISYTRDFNTTGLVAYWKFDENNSNQIDDSIYANKALLFNNVSFTNNGKIGGTYNMDGIDDYIRANYISAYNFSTSNQFAITLWVYPSKSSYSNYPTVQAESTSGGGFNVTRGSMTYRLGNRTSGPVALVNNYKYTNTDYGTFSFIITGNTTATNTINYSITDSQTGAILKSGATTDNTAGINGQVLFTGFEPAGRDFNVSIFYTNLTEEGSVDRFDIERGGRDGILTKGSNYRIMISSSLYRAIIRNSTGSYISISPHSITARQWTMITLLYNGTHMQMYKDLSASASTYVGTGILVDNTPIQMGWDSAGFNFGQAWLKVDEVKLFNRTLTPTEITNLYSITNPTFQEYANITTMANITDEDTPQGNLWYEWFVDGVSKLTGFAQNIFNWIFTGRNNIVQLNVNDTNGYFVNQTWNISTTFINPLIQFVSPTETSGSNLSRNNLLINITFSDANLANATINLYNTTGIVNSTTSTTPPLFINVTALPNGIYYFNATVLDLVGNANSTNTRTVILDTVAPLVLINSPTPQQIIRDRYNYTISLNTTITDSLAGISLRWYSINNGVTNTTFTTSITNVAGLSAGQNTIYVWTNDTAGNLNSTSVTFNLTFTPKINTINVSNSTTSYGRNDYSNGLILWLKLDENNTIQKDSSPYSNNGTINGNAAFTDSGKIGGGYKFYLNNTNDRITIPANAPLNDMGNNTLEYTLSLWVRTNLTIITDSYIINKWAGATYPFNFRLSSSGWYSGFWNGTSGCTASTSAINIRDNNWHFLVATYNLSAPTQLIKIYTDSVLQTTSGSCLRIGNISNNANMLIPNGGITIFNGTIDEMRIYNRSLSALEIQSLYSITNPTFQEVANITTVANITDEDTLQTNLWYEWFVDGVSKLSGFAQNIFNWIFTQRQTNVTLVANDSNNYKVNQTWIINTNYINPVINFTSPTPNNGTVTASTTLNANVTGTEANRDTVWLRLDNANYTTSCNGSPTYTCNVTITGLTDGTHNLTAYINDTVGNSNNTETRRLIVDLTPPTNSILSPPNNTFVNGLVVIDGTASDANGVNYASIQYKNSTLSYTNFSTCNALSFPYDCIWNVTDLQYSNSSEGYDVRIVACDNVGNCNTTAVPMHYIIDRLIPILDVNGKIVIYPTGQMSARNGQEITLKINVTDGSGAGMNQSWINLSLINGTTELVPMNLESGLLSTAGEWTLWNMTSNLSGTTTGLWQIGFYANDSASPKQNRMFNTMSVEIDNTPPTFSSLSYTPSGDIYNKTIVNFSVIAEDNFNLSHYIFSNNFSGTWVNITKNFTSALLDTAFNSSRMYTGNYSYYWIFFDDAGNSNQTSIQNITILGMTPEALVVSLINPTDFDSFSLHNITFQFSYTNGTASACNFILDNIVNQTFNSPTSDTTIELNRTINALGTHTWYAQCNNSLGTMYNSSIHTLFLIDTINPIINFVSPTENSGVYRNQSDIIINVTASDEYLKSILINLYNSTSLVFSNSSLTSPFYINYSSLPEDIYYYNATANDTSDNIANIETRNITLDRTIPNGTLISPTNGTITTQSTNNFTVNITDNLGIKNATLSIYNNTGLVNQTSVTLIGELQKVVGIIVTLVNGVYTWFYNIFDFTGHQFTTNNNTLTIDNTNPSINFTNPTETSGNYISRNNILVNVTATDAIAISNITINIYSSSGVLLISDTSATSPFYANYTSYIFNDPEFGDILTYLSDGLYFFNSTVLDTAGNSNNTETRNITLDITNPRIEFVSPTQNSGVNLSRNYIEANVTVTETNFKNITFNLYNSTSLVNSTTFISQTFYLNWSNLQNNFYYYNVTVKDLANNINSTETRTITLDRTSPNATLSLPSNNTFTINSSNNFTANLTDNLSGIKNATLNIYNSSNNLVNQTTVTLSGQLQTIIGIFVNLIDNVYNWFYDIFDFAGNRFITGNNTITIDTINPLIQFVIPTLNSSSLVSQNYIFANVSVTEINEKNITFNLYNTTNLVNQTTFTTVQRNINWTGLIDGIYYYNVTVYDKASSINSTETRNITLDASSPTTNITYPTNNSIFNNSQINLNYTVSDLRLDSCWWSNSSGIINNSITCGVNITSQIWDEGLNTIILYANDTLGNIGSGSVTFRVDTINPIVTLISPDETRIEEFAINSSVPLTINVSDINGSGAGNCYYSIDNGANVSIVNCVNTTFGTSEGRHNITVYINDSAGNRDETNATFIISLNAPAINLNSPQNYTLYNSSRVVYLNWTAIDPNDIALCQIWHNINGSFSLNKTRFDISSNVMASESYNITQDGDYIWNIFCSNTVGKSRFSANNYTFIIDSTPPNITIDSISTTQGSQTISFSSTESDAHLVSCKYSIFDQLGNVDGLNNNVSFSCNVLKSATVSDYDTFNLTIWAIDLLGNENSDTELFTTAPSTATSGGGGGSTKGATVSVVALKPLEGIITLTPPLNRAILYARIIEICTNSSIRKDSCILTNQSLEQLNVRLVSQNIDIPFSEILKWIDRYNTDSLENINVLKTDSDKYKLVEAIVKLLGEEFIITPKNLDTFWIIFSDTFTTKVTSSRELKDARIVEGERGFSVNITQGTSAEISYKLQSDKVFTFKTLNAKANYVDIVGNSIFQPITIRAINLRYINSFGLPGYLLLFLALILIFAFVIRKNRRNKKVLSNLVKEVIG